MFKKIEHIGSHAIGTDRKVELANPYSHSARICCVVSIKVEAIPVECGGFIFL